MADDTTDTTAADEGATKPPAGVPNPNPTLPDASTEPAAQATAPAAETIPPPLPADYEMPDDYADEDPVAQAKAWVEAHPGLALLGAAGIGLLAGRIVTALLPESEPPSLADRVEKRAKGLRKEAKKRGELFADEARKRGKTYSKEVSAYADDAGDTLQESLHRAAEALREAASHAGDAAEEGYEKTKDLAETIADAAKVAVTGVVATKIDDWVKKARN